MPRPTYLHHANYLYEDWFVCEVKPPCLVPAYLLTLCFYVRGNSLLTIFISKINNLINLYFQHQEHNNSENPNLLAAINIVVNQNNVIEVRSNKSIHTGA